MYLKQKIKYSIDKIARVPIWTRILLIILFIFTAFVVVFFRDKSVQFSYSEKRTCVQQIIFLPSFNTIANGSKFIVEYEDNVKIGNFSVISQRVCFRAKDIPSVGVNKIDIAIIGGWFAKKTFVLNISDLPKIRSTVFADKPIPITRPIEIKLSESDMVFDYQLEAGNKKSQCKVSLTIIFCDVEPLGLSQGADYDMKLTRMFNGEQVGVVLNNRITTLSSTKVISSSINQDQIVYNNPKTITVNFDKDIIHLEAVVDKIEAGTHTPVAQSVVLNNKESTINLQKDLDRNSSYELSIKNLEATDGSTLDGVYTLNFKTSDGPTVTSVNTGAIAAPLTWTMVLTFDQDLSDDQDISKLVSVDGAASIISKVGNQVFIKYSNANLCKNINVKVNAGIQSSYGITQNQSWSYSTRTICHLISTIGYSVEGRPILAYTFGSGSRTVLYTGSIHGNELSTKYLMDAWINELEQNVGNIPTDKTLIIVPTLNPDGVAANRRNNSNNVDLNRNFPSSDWQTDVFSPSNQPVYGGGGARPLSEPESQAIAAFTVQLRPRLTMSFHSSASYVIANQAGDSVDLANVYQQLAGYRNMTNVGGGFSYPITGTYDDWMREVYGFPSVIVELSSSSNSEFSRNRAALWAMARS